MDKPSEDIFAINEKKPNFNVKINFDVGSQPNRKAKPSSSWLIFVEIWDLRQDILFLNFWWKIFAKTFEFIVKKLNLEKNNFLCLVIWILQIEIKDREKKFLH